MELREFLFRNNLSGAQFGRMVNYDPQYINSVVRGVRKPGKKLIKLIEGATYGKVQESDLIKAFQKSKKMEIHDFGDPDLVCSCKACQAKHHDNPKNK